MLTYIIVSLVSLIVGAVAYAKFGAIGLADLAKLEESIKSHVTSTEARLKADVAKAKTL